jgi:hypothetical protein
LFQISYSTLARSYQRVRMARDRSPSPYQSLRHPTRRSSQNRFVRHTADIKSSLPSTRIKYPCIVTYSSR